MSVGFLSEINCSTGRNNFRQIYWKASNLMRFIANKSDHHDITEILLNAVLNTMTLPIYDIRNARVVLMLIRIDVDTHTKPHTLKIQYQ